MPKQPLRRVLFPPSLPGSFAYVAVVFRASPEREPVLERPREVVSKQGRDEDQRAASDASEAAETETHPECASMAWKRRRTIQVYCERH